MHAFYKSCIKWIVLCVFLNVSFCLPAQNRDFFSFPLPDIGLQNQGLIGNLGKRFLLLNTENRAQLALSIFDTSSRQLTKLAYPFSLANATWVLSPQSVVFAGIENDSKGASCHFLEIDQDGKTLRNQSLNTISGLHPSGPASLFVHGPNQAITIDDLPERRNGWFF